MQFNRANEMLSLFQTERPTLPCPHQTPDMPFGYHHVTATVERLVCCLSLKIRPFRLGQCRQCVPRPAGVEPALTSLLHHKKAIRQILPLHPVSVDPYNVRTIRSINVALEG